MSISVIEPLVTIITPTYNQVEFIEATIKSVLAQSYKNIEYIVIDAMSDDGTDKMLELYKNQITKVIREPDEGQSDAIVKGFKMANGELIGWINSDDLLHSDCVEKIVIAYKKSPDAVLFYNSKMDIVAKDGSYKRLMSVPLIDREHLLRTKNTLIQPGSFYAKKALIEVGYLDKKLKFSMDLDLCLRLLKIGRAVDVGGDSIASYREWEGTKTSNGAISLLKERKKLLITHGANITDKSMLLLNFELIKHYIKSIPYFGDCCKFVVNLLRMTFNKQIKI